MDVNYGKIIANNLRRILLEKHKTQADVSRDLRISKATVSSWTNGTRIPRMKNIDMLCHYLNVKRTDIMEPLESDTLMYSNPDISVLIEEAQDCPPEYIKSAVQLLRTLKETRGGK